MALIAALSTALPRAATSHCILQQGCTHGIMRAQRCCISLMNGATSSGNGGTPKAAADEIVESLSTLVTSHRETPLQLPALRQALRNALDVAENALPALEQSTPASEVSTRSASLPADLTSLRVDELKVHLKAMKLPTSGRKAELCERIERARALSQAEPITEVATAQESAERRSTESTLRDATKRLDSSLRMQLAQVMRRHMGVGPQTGIFCDGACAPNPGPGGWGFVRVDDGRVIDVECGFEHDTTNNRMELKAIINALQSVGPDEAFSLYSDSNLCVRTLNEWAAGWQRSGWKRGKGQDIMNLDLVQRAFALKLQRPNVTIRWIAAHEGNVWNEYADRLATHKLSP